jgi:hypothetical protein
MEGSILANTRNCTGQDIGVTPEELKKSTRSNKWFKLGCKSTVVSPTPGTAVSGNEAKEDMSTTRHSTAPKIRRSRAPLVVNYFPTGVTLSLR